MNDVIIIVSRFIFIIALAYYTFVTYRDLSKNKYRTMFMIIKVICIMAIDMVASYVLLAAYEDNYALMYIFILFVVIIAYLLIYFILYKDKCIVIAVNIAMLLSISLIMIYRLNSEKTVKHLCLIIFGLLLSLVLPYFLNKLLKEKNSHIYAGIFGIVLLLAVAIAGRKDYGALLSISVFGISFQPIEIVKPVYVVLLAGLLKKRQNLKTLINAGIWTLAYIGILAFANDFGSVLLITFVYITLVYVASKKSVYIFTGLGVLGILSILAVRYVSHIQTRVEAWIDPFSLIDNKGYQMCQSLFAIVSGGFFGTGLTLGMPEKIPVVEKDFIFSAICEEFGAIFGICLILICLAIFINVVLLSQRIKNIYNKFILFGLALMYIFQCLLTIGSSVNFLPSTGVTLPFVSYGGSSMLGSFITFSIVISIVCFTNEKGDKNEKQ